MLNLLPGFEAHGTNCESYKPNSSRGTHVRARATGPSCPTRKGARPAFGGPAYCRVATRSRASGDCRVGDVVYRSAGTAACFSPVLECGVDHHSVHRRHAAFHLSASLTEFLLFRSMSFVQTAAVCAFFVTDYLGWQSLLPASVSFVCGVWAVRGSWRPTWTRTQSIAALTIPHLGRRHTHRPLTAADRLRSTADRASLVIGAERIVPSLVLPSRATAIPLSLEPSPLASARSIHYDHVFICVFEGVTEANLEADTLSPATASGTACRTIR